MNATIECSIPKFSERTHPLTPDEIAAALHAIHRILVVTRDMNRRGTTQADMERILDATENLPAMLMRPAEYEDLFEATLADLANAFPAMIGIHKEFRLSNALHQADPAEEQAMAEEGMQFELKQWPEY